MSFNILEHLISENLSYSQEYFIRMSHSKYHPIPMSAHQVLQSYALFSFPRTCTPATMPQECTMNIISNFAVHMNTAL